MLPIRAIAACAFAVIGLSACLSSTSPPVLPTCTGASVVVFRDEDFYRARTEIPEQIVGLMRHTPIGPTPAGRDFQFHLDDLAVYSGNAATSDLILSIAGRTVVATGKTVDVGYGPELWIDTVCPAD